MLSSVLGAGGHFFSDAERFEQYLYVFMMHISLKLFSVVYKAILYNRAKPLVQFLEIFLNFEQWLRRRSQ